MDAATADAAAESGRPDPCLGRTDLAYCDGFEDATLGVWGAPVLTNGNAERTTAQSRSGMAALHAITGAANGSSSAARYAVEAFDRVKSGDIWARAYFLLPSTFSIDTSFSILRLAERDDPGFGCSVVIRPDHVELAGVTNDFKAPAAFPRDRWTCVELHVEIKVNGGICEGYVDGAIASRSQAGDTQPAKGFTKLYVGIHEADAAQGPVEVFVDEVGSSTGRVGCD